MQIGTADEHFKYIAKKEYEKNNEVVVDDLFILSLENCKKSQLKFCLYCEELIQSEQAQSILTYYKSACETFKVSLKLFNRIASKENCAGILVCCKINALPIKSKEPLILVCDGLEISGNIGTIFRTCEAVAVDLILFTNINAKINDDKVVRASRGMIFNVPYVVIDDLKSANEYLNKFNARKIICEPEEGKDFKEIDYNGSVALIVGSERYGVNEYWFTQNCEKLKIPMFGQMDSLNVGVATSLILYEAKYNRNKK